MPKYDYWKYVSNNKKHGDYLLNMEYHDFYWNSITCSRYCKYCHCEYTRNKEIPIKCLSYEEKIIKDLLE